MGGKAAELCDIWHCFQILRCNNAMDEDAACGSSAHMYVEESALANIEMWERLNAWRRVKTSVRSRLGNPYGDDVESGSQQ